MNQRESSDSTDPSTGQLMAQLSEQTSRLVRDEVSLAQAELKRSATRLGFGVGLFSTAGVLALYGLGVLITVAIVALDLAMPLWLAALLVALVLFAAAGTAALTGKSKLDEVSSALYGIATMHEQLGQPDSARAYYARFVKLTEKGEPLPRIVEARNALARLAKER